VTLSDQTRITLGADTSLKVHYTAGARIVDLERGEALFRVEHDPTRPFTVHSDGGSTTAVGTEFEVRKYADHVQVWVREGAVELESAAGFTSVRLSEGQELSYDAAGKQTQPHRVDPHLTAAWTEGRLVPLVYRKRPLPEVIEDLQPYTRRRIVLDITVAALRYSGIVKQEDADAWIHDLVTIYPVDVVDCRQLTNRAEVRGCTRPENVVIRSKMMTWPAGPKSVQR
jgi:transmembrane sensor